MNLQQIEFSVEFTTNGIVIYEVNFMKQIFAEFTTNVILAPIMITMIIRSGPQQNQTHVEYTNRYHRNLYFHNVRTDLNCRFAASFASQSHHNIIGRTNEIFENIKYYKINDNGNSFWIECYDNDDINIPISFDDDVVLTMDVVFLQNHKLLYS